MFNDALIVELMSAVLANTTVDKDRNLKLNITVAREMVENVLVKHEIRKVKRRLER
jgi:hypothetical protein